MTYSILSSDFIPDPLLWQVYPSCLHKLHFNIIALGDLDFPRNLEGAARDSAPPSQSVSVLQPAQPQSDVVASVSGGTSAPFILWLLGRKRRAGLQIQGRRSGASGQESLLCRITAPQSSPLSVCIYEAES